VIQSIPKNEMTAAERAALPAKSIEDIELDL